MTATFSALGIAEEFCRALAAIDITVPTPIQAQAIPHLLAGRDLLGIAQTGTGKTAAFGLPLLQRLQADKGALHPKCARALILAPTRELAVQITDGLKSFGRFTGLRIAVIFGGVGQGPQVKAMARGVDVLVATPGRLLDLVDQGHVVLGRAQYLVLDEADRMLDMGFIRDVRRVVALLPRQRQSLLFSATMPANVEELARSILKDPVGVTVTPEVVTVEKIDQRVYFVETAQKRRLLEDLLADGDMSRVIVFTRTKHGANRVAEQLEKAGFAANAIHGNKSQGARQRALDDFRTGEARILVATDIAARGIDVPGVTHVVNFDLPNEPEAYVHRIGRTARAGAGGIALSFCDAGERGHLKQIERLTKRPLTVEAHSLATLPASHADEPRRAAPSRQRSGRPAPAGRPAANRGPAAGAARRRVEGPVATVRALEARAVEDGTKDGARRSRRRRGRPQGQAERARPATS